MVLKLYCNDRSPPCRAVLLVAKTIGVEIEEIQTELYEGKDVTPQFIKLNPQRSIPILVEEDGRSIWDSHAIMIYLVEKYGKDDSLYPKDPYKRAIIDQRLHFDSGVLWNLAINVLKPIVLGTIKEIPSEKFESANEIYSFIEKFLEGHQWIAGDNLSLADFSIYTTLETLDVVIPCDSDTFPKITAWMKKVQVLPHFEFNKYGLESFKKFYSRFLNIITNITPIKTE